jgi:hypothetical protein
VVSIITAFARLVPSLALGSNPTVGVGVKPYTIN